MLRWEAHVASRWLNDTIAKFTGNDELTHRALCHYWATLVANVENSSLPKNFVERVQAERPLHKTFEDMVAVLFRVNYGYALNDLVLLSCVTLCSPSPG
jgi:hypothetical protein